MSRTLADILKLGDTGHTYIFKTFKHYDSKEMLEHYRQQLESRLRFSSNARWDLALTLANLVRSASWTAYYSETRRLDDLWKAANPNEDYKN